MKKGLIYKVKQSKPVQIKRPKYNRRSGNLALNVKCIFITIILSSIWNTIKSQNCFINKSNDTLESYSNLLDTSFLSTYMNNDIFIVYYSFWHCFYDILVISQNNDANFNIHYYYLSKKEFKEYQLKEPQIIDLIKNNNKLYFGRYDLFSNIQQHDYFEGLVVKYYDKKMEILSYLTPIRGNDENLACINKENPELYNLFQSIFPILENCIEERKNAIKTK